MKIKEALAQSDWTADTGFNEVLGSDYLEKAKNQDLVLMLVTDMPSVAILMHNESLSEEEYEKIVLTRDRYHGVVRFMHVKQGLTDAFRVFDARQPFLSSGNGFGLRTSDREVLTRNRLIESCHVNGISTLCVYHVDAWHQRYGKRFDLNVIDVEELFDEVKNDPEINDALGGLFLF